MPCSQKQRRDHGDQPAYADGDAAPRSPGKSGRLTARTYDAPLLMSDLPAASRLARAALDLGLALRAATGEAGAAHTGSEVGG